MCLVQLRLVMFTIQEDFVIYNVNDFYHGEVNKLRTRRFGGFLVSQPGGIYSFMWQNGQHTEGYTREGFRNY